MAESSGSDENERRRAAVRRAKKYQKKLDTCEEGSREQRMWTRQCKKIQEALTGATIPADFNDQFSDVHTGLKVDRTPSDEMDSSGPNSSGPHILKYVNCKKVSENDKRERYLFVKKARVLMFVNRDFTNKAHARDEAGEDYLALQRVLIKHFKYDDFLREVVTHKEQYGLTKQLQNIKPDQIEDISWSRRQMLAIIKAMVTPHDDDYNGEAFFVFISSHGNNRDGQSYVTDCFGEPLFVDEIIQTMHTHSDKLLNFIFIQACLGNQPVPTVDINVEPDIPTPSVERSIPPPVGLNYDAPGDDPSSGARGDAELGATSTDTSNGYPVLEHPKHFLLAYSTRKHHLSGRLSVENTQFGQGIEQGSIFLQIFLAHLSECSTDIRSSEGILLEPLLTGCQQAATVVYQENPEIVDELECSPVLCRNVQT